MKASTINYTDTGYFSNLMQDYLAKNPELSSFYNRFPELESFKHQIEEKSKSFTGEQRKVLVDVLKQQYNSFNTSEKTNQNIDALALPNTYTVTTGHQLNLFTGPLYFLYKIVSAINLAEQLKTAYPEQNFVPIYWMASEDHDFEEINFFNFKGQKVVWPKVTSGAVGEIETDGLETVFGQFKSQLGLGKNAKQLVEWFEKAYLEHDNLASATLYLANELFKDYGLVIVDANVNKLKALFKPCIIQELIKQTSVTEVEQTNIKLKEQNYPIQVNPRDINLFYIVKGIRERIVKEGVFYKVLNTDLIWSETQIIEEVEHFPERFSPNVILRPLYQEVVLPNLCYIGGGGEMAYWFQLKANFEAFNVPFPILLLRNSALLQTTKQESKVDKMGLSTSELFLKQDTLVDHVVKQKSEIAIDFAEQKAHLKSQFKALYNIADKTDASFLGSVAAQERKQIKGLETLEKRLLKAQKQILSDTVLRVTRLQNELFPQQNLQERKTNFAEFYLEYGIDLIPNLIANLDPLAHQFTVLTF